jgi:hypothetical protein
MIHRVRSAFARLLALGAVAAIVVTIAVPPLYAQQTTGKVEGTVSDQAGVALANAQVLIVGTSFGAVTNDKGYYFINNVPVGTYNVRAQLIGFAPFELRDVRVFSGQTITENFKMSPSAIQVGGVSVEASNPLVPRDQVTSKSSVQGALINNLPVDDVRNAIALQPGVVESGSGAGVSIRGGRPGEANVYIDGTPVRGTNNGAQRITLGVNSVEEATVTTGAIGVEFSDAQSGIISYSTRSGGEQLKGSFSYESDEPFGNSMSYGYNRFEGSIGGPVIGKLHFFGSSVVQGQLTGFRAMGADKQPFFSMAGVDQLVVDSADGSARVLPKFAQYGGQCGSFGSTANATATAIKNNYGFDCQGVRLPMAWTNTIQATGKLTYDYGSGSSVSLTGLAQGNQNRDYPGTSIGGPSLYTGTHTWQRLAVLNLNQSVFKSAERELALTANLSWGRDRSIFGPLDPTSELDSRNPTMGITFTPLKFATLDHFPQPIDDQIIRNIRSNEGLRVPLGYLADQSSLETAQGGFRDNPYGMIGRWATSGVNTGVTLLQETRYNGQVMVDWQANRYHRFKFGGDFKKTDLSYYNSSQLRQIFMDAYVVHPVWYGLFASDHLDLGDVVIELGARWDYYNSHTLFSKTPGRIFTDDAQVCANGITTAEDPTACPSGAPHYQAWSPDAGTSDAAYDSSLARVFTPSVGHHIISPRLRVSFPVNEQTDFRLSYSHQVQTPEFTTLLTGINNDLSFTNSNDVFGRDLDFGKTILFEFGVRHSFNKDMVLDVAAYNKDKLSDFAARILPYVDPHSPTDTLNVNVLTNRDFGNARGIDTKFDWRVTSFFTIASAYTFQVSKNTGSDPFSYLNTFAREVSGLSGDRVAPPEAAQRTNDDRTHNLVGAIALAFPSDFKKGTTVGNILRNVGAFATVRVQSGLAYTRLNNEGNGQTAPRLAFGLGGRAIEPLNNSSMPWTKYVDMRITKGVRFGRADVTAFADIRNLFNFKNIVSLFAETGDVVNSNNRAQVLSSEYSQLTGEANIAGALEADNQTIDLRPSCQNWGKPLNCESLRRVEARFGNGDGEYTLPEQERALNTFYDSFFGSYRFNDQARNIRLGFEVQF